MKNTHLKFDIVLDENHIPESIKWDAPDGGVSGAYTKAVLVSIWDDRKKQALRIDLWTKEMPVDDMKIFFHQILSSMGATYLKATGEQDIAEEIDRFAEYFSDRSGIKQ